MMSHFVWFRDFVKRWHLHQIPPGQNAVKIQHLRSFGENSRSSTNFQDSEDVGEDVISSLGWGHPSTLPISQWESEDIALVGDIQKCKQEHSKAMSTGMRNTVIQCWTRTRSEKYTIDRDIRVGTWWHLSSSVELGSGNLRSHGEVVNVMLWGLMSSGGGVTRFRTSQGLSAMLHECYRM